MKMFAKQIVGRSCALIGVVGLSSSILSVSTQTAFCIEGISDGALQQISALQAEKASRTAAQIKMDSQLVYALKQSRGQAIAPGVPTLINGADVQANGTVLVDIDAQVGPALLDAIRAAGGTVYFSSDRFSSVHALIPLAQAENIAGRADVRFVKPAVKAMTRTGSVDSEGDVTHRADRARTIFGVTGAGVKVGVLSDSVDFLTQAQSTGDLPPNVTILPGQAGVGAGEGTAMLEIVNDLAPGAQLFFASGFNGEAQFAQNILDLRAAGCDIIVDDIGYFDESPFQDSTVTLAVNSVTADGALYFSSAGNEGSLVHGTSGTWEGDFADGGAAGAPVNGKQGILHSFGPVSYDTAVARGFATVLHWSDPLGASTNDYDLFVLDATGANIISSSTTVQNGTQNPYEIVPSPRAGERIVVVKASGDPRFLHIDTIRGQLSINTAGNITGHATATNAFAVAAVDVHTSFPNPFSGGNANPVEFFSTDGPRRGFYTANGQAITPGNYMATGGFVRQKPDIAAADGVVTTLPPNSGLNPFYGTSAAAPHAAAIAALLKSYNPTLTYTDIKNLFGSTALDIEGLAVDANSGAGIVMAEQVLRAAPVGVNLIMVTNFLSGGNGNGIIDFNECNDLTVILQNVGLAGGTNIQAILSTTNAEVIIAQPVSAYPNLGPGEIGTNLVPFKISTSPSFVCGTTLYLNFVVKSDEGIRTNVLQFVSGTNGVPIRFDGVANINIPDADPIGTNSPVSVSGILSPVGKVTLSMFITHTYDSDLTLELVAPDGTTALLSANNGFNGNNYGITCSDPNRAKFDDASSNPISAATPPFVGTFRPQSPLSVFAGKTGTNVNGIWKLHVVDSVGFDVGTIQCWSLFISPAVCNDGGGQCPGADLAIDLSSAPDPVFIGSNLVYTITVTNHGPNIAKSTVVSQVLPGSAVFVSASSSQGLVSQSGGVVTASLGSINPKGSATVTVIVTPTVAGLISSTASVSSSENDFDLSNNSATVNTHVNPPFADLAVGLVGSPDPVPVGNPLTFTVTVTNKGPSSASGVIVTNVLPVSVSILNAVPSQGFITISGNTVVCNFGSLTSGGRASAVINVIPSVEGTVTGTATGTANQTDPLLDNNTATATVTVAPSADLALGFTDNPDPVVLRSNLTYTINVTNLGPSTATSVTVNQTLPAGVTVISSNTTRGTITISGNSMIGNLGTMTNGARATITIVVSPLFSGVLSSSASVSGAQGDPVAANNSGSVSTVVSAPLVTILPAGATLTVESYSPTNGTVEPGETVTVQLRLQNAGNVANTNLVATLLATNGITSPSGPRVYGILKPVGLGGFPVAQSFTFTAAGTNGQTLTALLQLQDGVNNLGTVAFNFILPSMTMFSNTASITIPDSGTATPYPSVIHVAGVTGLVGRATVTLSNLSHTFPRDVSVLLVGPTGAKSVLMSHAAEGSLNGVSLTFDDGASTVLPASGQLSTGAYQPAAYDDSPLVFPAPAPSGPYPAALSSFNGASPNGDWSLYVLDTSAGDQGVIAGGWSLSLTTLSPVNQVADLITSVTAIPSTVLVGNNVTNIFSITNAGPNNASIAAFTNPLPANVTFVSATSSQGACSLAGNSVVCNIGALNFRSNATITIVSIPNVAGTLASTGTVGAAEIDLNPANNTAVSSVLANLPVADIGVSASAIPPVVTVGSNLTYTIVVTNSGPNTALNIVLSNTLPAGVAYVSSGASQGSVSNLSGTVIAALGALPSGGSAGVTLIVTPGAAGAITNVTRVWTLSSDGNSANNSVSTVSSAANPAALIAAAGATILSESFSPPNASIEPGETVTLAFRLANTGAVDTANLVSTLLTSGGVTSPSAAQSYGVVTHGGPAVSRNFTFTANPSASGALVATFQLQDGANNLGTVSFTFLLPTSGVYSNTTAILIPDHGPAYPYPSTIQVSGATGVVSKITATLKGLSHGFPADLDILLVGPTGQRLMLMSDAGGGYSITNLNLTFDDAAAAGLPDAARITSGSYKPTDFQPGDVLPSAELKRIGTTTLSGFNGSNPNGTWSLYVVDDSTGDSGVVAGGWTLAITTINPVNAVANLSVTMSAGPNPVFVGSGLTYSVTVANLGPATATGVTLSDLLPPEVTLISNYVSQGTATVAGSSVTLNIGTLNPGAGASASIRVSPFSTGTLSNTVAAVGNEADLDVSNNSATAVVNALSPLAPRLDIQRAGNQFEVSILAQPGQVYVLQSSTNLVSWTPVATNLAPVNGTIKITATNVPAFTQRFYRAVRVP